ncbi:MAG: thermonuclease family protein [Planctomycetota bacterium]|nr:thermonuclease family protein [Planctomycetota bacterium]
MNSTRPDSSTPPLTSPLKKPRSRYPGPDRFGGWRRAIRTGAVLALILGLSWADHHGWFLHRGTAMARFDGREFRVTRVVNVDELEIESDAGAGPGPGTRPIAVRLVGLRGPASSPLAPRSKMPVPPAPTSSVAVEAARELAEGQVVRLELPIARKRDRLGRLFAYVQLRDGSFLQEALLARGMARISAQLDHPRFDSFRKLERDARRTKAGLWAMEAQASRAKAAGAATRPATMPISPTLLGPDRDDGAGDDWGGDPVETMD